MPTANSNFSIAFPLRHHHTAINLDVKKGDQSRQIQYSIDMHFVVKNNFYN